MDSRPRPLPGLSELTAPLLTRFGEDLTLARDGDAVRWSYAGNVAVVQLLPGGSVAAKYISRSVPGDRSPDLCAVYAPRTPAYPLTGPGVARMVEDLTEFFLGTREPRFSFVDVHVEGFPS